VLSYEQHAGRGQQAAIWLSNPGENLLLSIIYYPRFLPTTSIFLLNKIASLAVASTVDRFLSTSLTVQNSTKPLVQIKWPNDILVNGQKIAGILIENQLSSNRVETSVIGIGLNVNQTYFPSTFARPAVSLNLLTGEKYALETVLVDLLEELEKWYLLAKTGSISKLDKDQLQKLYCYQEWSNFEDANGTFQGMIIGVDRDGKLAVQRENKLTYYDLKEIAFV